MLTLSVSVESKTCPVVCTPDGRVDHTLATKQYAIAVERRIKVDIPASFIVNTDQHTTTTQDRH